MLSTDTKTRNLTCQKTCNNEDLGTSIGYGAYIFGISKQILNLSPGIQIRFENRYHCNPDNTGLHDNSALLDPEVFSVSESAKL